MVKDCSGPSPPHCLSPSLTSVYNKEKEIFEVQLSYTVINPERLVTTLVSVGEIKTEGERERGGVYIPRTMVVHSSHTPTTLSEEKR